MVNRSGRLGAAWEHAVVEYLKANGFPHAERRKTEGAKDRGDIAGIPGFVIEAKNEKTLNLPGALKELLAEKHNADVELGACFVKQRGKGVAQGYFVLSIEDGVAWMRHILKGKNV